jgi:hypothetical protein
MYSIKINQIKTFWFYSLNRILRHDKNFYNSNELAKLLIFVNDNFRSNGAKFNSLN